MTLLLFVIIIQFKIISSFHFFVNNRKYVIFRNDFEIGINMNKFKRLYHTFSTSHKDDYLYNSTVKNVPMNHFDLSLSPNPITSSGKSKYYRNFLPSLSILIMTDLLIKNKANAAKGAFEMDAEFYLKDLFNSNINNDVNNKILKLKPIFRSPRKLNIEFAGNTIDIITKAISTISMISVSQINNNVNENVDYYLKYFKNFVPIESVNYCDQYYFDMMLYIYYLDASKIITESVNRVELRRLVGQELLKYISNNNKNSGLLVQYPGINLKDKNEENIYFSRQLTILSNGIKEILNSFKSNGIIADYQFDSEDLIDESYAYSSFADGLGISFQLTLLEPATILGFLLQSASNTFFHPEIIATTIANYGRRLGYKIRYEDYLLDRYYRTENKDLQAQDVLLEFGLFSPTTKEIIE